MRRTYEKEINRTDTMRGRIIADVGASRVITEGGGVVELGDEWMMVNRPEVGDLLYFRGTDHAIYRAIELEDWTDTTPEPEVGPAWVITDGEQFIGKKGSPVKTRKAAVEFDSMDLAHEAVANAELGDQWRVSQLDE